MGETAPEEKKFPKNVDTKLGGGGVRPKGRATKKLLYFCCGFPKLEGVRGLGPYWSDH